MRGELETPGARLKIAEVAANPLGQSLDLVMRRLLISRNEERHVGSVLPIQFEHDRDVDRRAN
jgi:hypothetical protein